MISRDVARIYARALFLSVKDKNNMDAAFDQLEDLKRYLSEDRSLLEFLCSPNIEMTNRRDTVRNVFAERFDRLIVEFLVFLVEKNRIAHLEEVIDEFVRLVEAERGVARATVVTAVPLIASEKADLTDRLATKTGLKIELEERIDESIVAGMIIILHDEIIDGSVRYGLDLLREKLAKVRVY